MPSVRGFVLTFASLLVAAPTAGCGSVYYSLSERQASSKLERAREMGAEKRAPYAYYFAVEHLRQAHVEAGDASYSDAASYADTAELYAQKAIESMQAKPQGDP